MQNPHDVFLAPAFVAAPNAVVKASVLSKGSDLCVQCTYDTSDGEGQETDKPVHHVEDASDVTNKYY